MSTASEHRQPWRLSPRGQVWFDLALATALLLPAFAMPFTEAGWTGFVLEREGRRLLVGGDTAETPLFRSHRRFGPFDAAIMPIGAYDPWIWNHCTPEQAVAMADAAGARRFLPIHHQTFRLSREGDREPIERAEAALSHEQGRLAWRDVGETVVIV